MFDKILIANRGDKGLKAFAAKPNCVMREAHAGDLDSIEVQHV